MMAIPEGDQGGEAAGTSPGTKAPDFKAMILARYDRLIGYYWEKSKYNKRSYKQTRYLTIVLGAVLTLISSLQSASFLKDTPYALTMAVATPVLAALMAIVSGISQAFQWGAAWSDMSITAARLERERARVQVTNAGQLDPVKEMGVLDGLVVSETEGFFQRLFGSGGPASGGNKQAE